MIISTISRGSLASVDDWAVRTPGESYAENSCVILARPRYQTRLTNSSVTVRGKHQEESWVVNIGVPDSEDVGVFVGDIVVSGGPRHQGIWEESFRDRGSHDRRRGSGLSC